MRGECCCVYSEYYAMVLFSRIMAQRERNAQREEKLLERAEQAQQEAARVSFVFSLSRTTLTLTTALLLNLAHHPNRTARSHTRGLPPASLPEDAGVHAASIHGGLAPGTRQ